MSQLMLLSGNPRVEEYTITTLEIADMMGVEHWKILRKLEGRTENGKHERGYIDILNDNNLVVVDYFDKTSYIDGKGEVRPCYNVTKLGCDFLANKFSGEKGVLFTAKYVRRFRDMENRIIEEKVEEKPRLQDVNNTVLILQNAYGDLGIDKRYMATMIGSVYKETGFNILLPYIKMEEEKIYDLTTIATELGVLSSAGNPHAQAVGAIIGMLDIAEDDKINTPYTHNGHSGVTVQYKKIVLEQVKEWLEDNGYPTTIKSNNKSYNVVYK